MGRTAAIGIRGQGSWELITLCVQCNSFSASIGDLSQMYAYNKFWKSSKAMLLYPGESDQQEFRPFRNPGEDEHACKMHFLSVDSLFKLEAYQQIIEEMVS